MIRCAVSISFHRRERTAGRPTKATRLTHAFAPVSPPLPAPTIGLDVDPDGAPEPQGWSVPDRVPFDLGWRQALGSEV